MFSWCDTKFVHKPICEGAVRYFERSLNILVNQLVLQKVTHTNNIFDSSGTSRGHTHRNIFDVAGAWKGHTHKQYFWFSWYFKRSHTQKHFWCSWYFKRSHTQNHFWCNWYFKRSHTQLTFLKQLAIQEVTNPQTSVWEAGGTYGCQRHKQHFLCKTVNTWRRNVEFSLCVIN
jgi:hypothetical protein